MAQRLLPGVASLRGLAICCLMPRSSLAEERRPGIRRCEPGGVCARRVRGRARAVRVSAGSGSGPRRPSTTTSAFANTAWAATRRPKHVPLARRSVSRDPGTRRIQPRPRVPEAGGARRRAQRSCARAAGDERRAAPAARSRSSASARGRRPRRGGGIPPTWGWARRRCRVRRGSPCRLASSGQPVRRRPCGFGSRRFVRRARGAVDFSGYSSATAMRTVRAGLAMHRRLIPALRGIRWWLDLGPNSRAARSAAAACRGGWRDVRAARAFGERLSVRLARVRDIEAPASQYAFLDGSAAGCA